MINLQDFCRILASTGDNRLVCVKGPGQRRPHGTRCRTADIRRYYGKGTQFHREHASRWVTLPGGLMVDRVAIDSTRVILYAVANQIRASDCCVCPLIDQEG